MPLLKSAENIDTKFQRHWESLCKQQIEPTVSGHRYLEKTN